MELKGLLRSMGIFNPEPAPSLMREKIQSFSRDADFTIESIRL